MATFGNPPNGSKVDDDQAQPQASNKLTTPWLRWFQALTSAVNNFLSYANSSVLVEVTGFSLTLATSVTTLAPAGTLAAGTLTMPPTPYDGYAVQVSTTQTITALTLNPSAGQTVKNAPTTLLVGTSFMYYYNAANLTWYRLL